MSLALLDPFPLACSGERYPAVPSTLPVSVIPPVVAVEDARDAEVGDVHVVARVEEEVGRFDVPVDERLCMRLVERLSSLLEPFECVASPYAAGLDPIGDRPFRQQLHDDERPPFPLADVVDGDDVGVTREPRRGKGLALEPPAARLVVGECSASTFTATRRSSSRSEAAKTSPMPPPPIGVASA